VLKGRASGELVLDKIMADEEVKVGEKVLTSGGDQIFPKGLAIGSVEKVRKGPEFLQVMVKPGARLNHLEEVLVILKKEERLVPVSNPGGVRAADILAERLPAVPDKPLQRASPSAASGGTQRTNSSPASAHGLAIENRTAGAKPRADTSEAATSPSGAAPAEPKTPAVAAPKPADNAPAGDTNKSAPPARDETAPESRGEAPH
jgi:rod shape-determining protein MreC